MSNNDYILVYLHDNLSGSARGFRSNAEYVKSIKLTEDEYIYYTTENPGSSSGMTFEHELYEVGYVLSGFKTKDNTTINLDTVYTFASLNNSTNVTTAPDSEDPTKTVYTLDLYAVWELNPDLETGKVLVSAMYLQEIANAIRYKNGLSRGYKLSEMPQAIRDLGN